MTQRNGSETVDLYLGSIPWPKSWMIGRRFRWYRRGYADGTRDTAQVFITRGVVVANANSERSDHGRKDSSDHL